MEFYNIKDWVNRSELHKLLDTSPTPKNIYAIGNWDPTLFRTCVAVVGSRHMTSYGKQVIEHIIPQLVLQKKTIVSGFMYGVDQYAHQICIENGGKTIAILGWGIDHVIDGTDGELAQRIVETGGLLLSEWQTQKPTLWTFPLRNRLIVGLSDEVIVIEAAEKSGSLITAKIAAKMKRKLWAVPGQITSRMSAGTNALIATHEAQMWLELRPSPQAAVTTQDPLLTILSQEALTVNEIAQYLHLPISQIGAQLTLLTIDGQVVERDGKYSLQ